MKIMHVQLSHVPLPPNKYGGTERVIWALYRAQVEAGHEVKFLWRKASRLPEGTIIYNKKLSIAEQIGDWPDVVHFHWPFDEELHKPYICTEHGNANYPRDYPVNTVFLSKSHAQNHGADCFVYNGLDWEEYGDPNFDNPGQYFHFLGKAKAVTKNIQGTVKLALKAGVMLRVMGGQRLNLGRNRYFFPQSSIRFHGMVGGKKKNQLIRQSSGLLFPVRWHEPFGLAITESLYLGVPVIATPYGSLPELVNHDGLGCLSNNYDELVDAILSVDKFDRRACHEHAKQHYGKEAMTKSYLRCYEKAIEGEALNRRRPHSEKSLIELLPMQ